MAARPIALLLPCLYTELEGSALPRIVEQLARVPFLDTVVIPIGRATSEQFEAAKRYVDWSAANNPDLIWRNGRNNDYNDWLNGDTFVGLPGWPKTGGAMPKDAYGTAFLAYSARLMSGIARAP